jgi:osmoprotectant transport system ATP-binding protein
VRRVADRTRRGDAAEGVAIAASATLAEALEAMIARRVDRLAVADESGERIGAITLADLVR